MRDTIERLAGAIAAAVAGQVAEAVGSLADEAADMGEDLLEASEDFVDTIEEQLPGGGAVGQVIDVVLFPGRLGLRVATTVLKGSAGEGRRLPPSRTGSPVTIWGTSRRPASPGRYPAGPWPSVVLEVLLETEEGKDEGREERCRPHDRRGGDPRPDAVDRKPVRKHVGDDQRDDRGDQRDAAERR